MFADQVYNHGRIKQKIVDTELSIFFPVPSCIM